jgi:UDP-glucose 4-epimerase
MLRGQPVTINGDGEQVRDYVYVADCARANLMVLDGGSGRVYNLGYGVGTTVNEIFTHLKALTGYDQDPNYGPAKAGETNRIYLDARRAADELGWYPTVALEDGLLKTVVYLKKELANS